MNYVGPYKILPKPNNRIAKTFYYKKTGELRWWTGKQLVNKAKRKEYRDENKANAKELRDKPDKKAKAKELRDKPGRKAKRKEYSNEYYRKNKAKAKNKK